METVVYRTIEYIPLALLGIGLYDFYFIHILSLAIGHYNHANLPFMKRVMASCIGGLVGAVLGAGAWETTLVTHPDLWTVCIGTLGGAALGNLILTPFLPYVFNNPAMHIWHHAKKLPEDRRYGVNFGLSLSVWDYLFNTAYVPYDGEQIELGFNDDENFPQDFIDQITYGPWRASIIVVIWTTNSRIHVILTTMTKHSVDRYQTRGVRAKKRKYIKP